MPRKKRKKEKLYECVYCGIKIKYEGSCDRCGYREDVALGKIEEV